jgi:ketosteroid isomerase-like protein
MASPDDAEAQFYEALREADLEKLMAVWADDEEIICVHPGGPRIVGPRAIRAAFEAIFGEGRIQAQVERVRRVHTLDAAMHSVVERVSVVLEQGPRTAFVLATNVYVKTPLGWRMVAHHASPGTGNETPDIAEAPSILH